MDCSINLLTSQTALTYRGLRTLEVRNGIYIVNCHILHSLFNIKLKLCEFRKFIFILKVAAHTQPTTLPSREWINDNSPELLAIDDFSRQAE